MSLTRRISDHFVRFQRQFGKKIVLGQKKYRVKGYISNILAVDPGADWEVELNHVFVDVLQTKGHFIDVGMNLGQTLGKVLTVDQNRHYVGFEPQVFACAMVGLFIKQNGLKNCTTLPIGLSNENGVKSFFSMGTADTMASLYDRKGAERSNIQVRVGDEVIQELGIEAICAIKIDVEGVELEVIEGLSATIGKFQPQIIFEVLPNFEGEERTPVSDTVAKQRRMSASGIMLQFKKLDYAVYQVLPNETEKLIEVFDLDDPSTFAGTNYVARPRQE